MNGLDMLIRKGFYGECREDLIVLSSLYSFFMCGEGFIERGYVELLDVNIGYLKLCRDRFYLELIKSLRID